MPIPSEQNPMIRTTARERVYKTLQQWIINGVLLPEERLNDIELARHFSVSRTPVREALQMLADQNLVTMVPSSGTFVSPIDKEDMICVYDLLGALQAYAIELGIQHVTEEILDKLTKINEQFLQQANAGNAIETLNEDWNFHHIIAELSKNHYLVTYTEQMMLQAHRNEIKFFKSQAHFGQSYAAHQKIIYALKTNDIKTAQACIKENWSISI